MKVVQVAMQTKKSEECTQLVTTNHSVLVLYTVLSVLYLFM